MKRLLDKLKSKFYNLKKRYYRKDSFYYAQVVDKYKDYDFHLKAHERAEQRSNLFTSNEVLYNNKINFGCTIDDIRKIYGSSHFIINQHDLLNSISILFCKTTIGGYKVKCEMFFWKDSLHSLSYIFPYLSAKDKGHIVSVLQNKYLNEPINYLNQKIIDSKGNIIMISDVSNFEIYYSVSTDIIFREAASLSEVNMVNHVNKEKQKAKQLYNSL
jgi:hypothetical protein